MKFLFSFLAFLISFHNSSGQNFDNLYSFMNKDLPNLEIGKSDWGIFYLDKVLILDSTISRKILDADWNESDLKLRDFFYEHCSEMSVTKQEQFKWIQSKFNRGIIVTDTKHKIPLSKIKYLTLIKPVKNRALYWVNQWNKSSIDKRLINYSSIPIFSVDKKYVLILRGQDVSSEGGWDTIYIYKKEKKEWTIWKKIQVTEI